MSDTTVAIPTVIGTLLVEILAGRITKNAIHDLQGLDLTQIPLPYHHLVGYVQGWTLDDDELLARDLLEELRLLCIELQEE